MRSLARARACCSRIAMIFMAATTIFLASIVWSPLLPCAARFVRWRLGSCLGARRYRPIARCFDARKSALLPQLARERADASTSLHHTRARTRARIRARARQRPIAR